MRPEPVTPDPPHRFRFRLLTQGWRDVTFVHWRVAPEEVASLLPSGTRPDTFDGATYVGVVAFLMYRVGGLGLPGIPYLGTFPETNVRLYSVDRHGRRGVVFLSLDASRLLPVLAGRGLFRLAYAWSRMSLTRDGDVVDYRASRRWPGPRGAGGRLRVRIGAPIDRPTPLEHFLTARWGLHSRGYFLPNTHPRWRLHRATLVEGRQDLTIAAGVSTQEPVSVLYSPGVAARFGMPRRG